VAAAASGRNRLRPDASGVNIRGVSCRGATTCGEVVNVQKLAKVLALAASDNDSEALHALRTARRLLEADGSDFVSLAARLGGGEGGDEVIEDLEDTIFDLRAELRQMRGDNERMKAELLATAVSGGLAEAAEAAASAIRLRARVAELTEEMEVERAEALRHRAHAAQISRQLEEAQAERRRLTLLAQALRARLDAIAENGGPLAPEAPFVAEAARAPRQARRRRAPGRADKALAQYALF